MTTETHWAIKALYITVTYALGVLVIYLAIEELCK